MSRTLHHVHAQVSWSVTADPLTGAARELCVRGNRVVWLEGLNPGVRSVRKVYGVETDILQALWCRFGAKKPRGGEKDGEGEREEEERKEGAKGSEEEGLLCICVREQNCLTLFLQTGAVHYVPLPFLVSFVPDCACTPLEWFAMKCMAGSWNALIHCMQVWFTAKLGSWNALTYRMQV